MLPRTETLDQTLERCAREIYRALRCARLVSIKRGYNFDAQRITIGSKLTDETVDESADLPDALRVARPATRDVYRALRALRKEVGAAARVQPTDLKEYLERGKPTRDQSIHTINHALSDLRARRVAWSHSDRGWQLGREQPTLPISGRQTDGPSGPGLRGYCERMADAGVRRFSNGRPGMSQKIWVPGEKSEYGVVVTDAKTEKQIAVAERTGEMRVPGRAGQLRTVPAARGELVRVEGGYAVVKFPTGEKLAVRVLGDWQLDGRTGPEGAELANTSGAA